MTSPNPPQTYSTGASALGWLLAVPALVGTLVSLVLPTGQTIWLSFQSGGVLRESTYAGLDNYSKLLSDGGFWSALGFTLSLTVIPLLVAVVVAPLLALALDLAGPWPRRAGRIVLSLAVVTFSPVAVAASWTRGLMPQPSGLASMAEGLRETATAPGTLRLIIAAATFGVVCALAVIAYLPALRGGTPVPASLAVGALVALATVAVGIQTFAMGLVLTRGGPERSTETLSGLQYGYAFREAQFGPGATVAVLTGVILGVLGIVATVIAVASRLRITLTPRVSAGARADGSLPDMPYAMGAPQGPGVPQSGPAPAPGVSQGGPESAPGVSFGGPASAPGVPHGAPAPAPGTPYGAVPAPGTPFGAPPAPGAPFGAAPAPGTAVGAAPGAPHGMTPPAPGTPPPAPRSPHGVTPPAVPGASSPGSREGRAAGPVWVAVGVVALVVFTAVGLLLAWPWMDAVLASPSSPAGSLGTQVNTWVPALAGALVSVGVAYLAALGIGGLRPLGRGSEWLLLAFAPWLFVGTGPLVVANWQNIRNLDLIDTFPALIPPLLVSVPALFVLTLLCKGLSERSGGDFFGGVLLRSLPMAGILVGAVTLVNAHDLLWPLLVIQDADLHTTPVSQLNQFGQFTAISPDVGAATPLLVVAVALAAVVVAQLLYLDRLAIATNGSRARTGAA